MAGCHFQTEGDVSSADHFCNLGLMVPVLVGPEGCLLAGNKRALNLTWDLWSGRCPTCCSHVQCY